MARLDRYRIGIPRELSEIRTQPWLSEESITCDPYHLEPSTFRLLESASRLQCIASQPRTSDRLACHWRALCLLAYDNWRCSINEYENTGAREPKLP